MNDADIIKALECCGVKESCTECYFNTHKAEDICARIVVQKALDLINRQKAEIERFSRAIHNMSITTEVQMRAEREFQWLQINRVKQARAEAITEFEDRLKVHAYYINFPMVHRVIDEDDIDQIAKEVKEGVTNA